MGQKDLSASPSFSTALLSAVRSGVLVIDVDRRVRMLNDALARALGVTTAEALGQRPGAVLKCLEALSDPDSCGISATCETCAARSLTIATLRGGTSHRGLVTLQVVIDGQLRDVDLRVTAAPFHHSGERLVLLVIDDLTPLQSLKTQASAPSRHGIVGRDPAILELQRTITQVAQSSAPVLIQGESGTGKELVATAIHRESPRADRLFVPVNCGALSEGLLESELFGHVKGAFTGALRDKKGRFQLADGGSLFLDEVGELTPSMQVRFLRVLQTGRFEPVGSERPLEVDARIICATNRELSREVAKGRFREDLFYRLNVFPLHVPPLRTRRGDIPEIAAHLLAEAAREDGFEPVPAMDDEVVQRLTAHDWPGNVRELENVLRFSLIRAGGETIETRHLPPVFAGAETSPGATSAGSRTGLQPAAVMAALEQTGGNKVKAAKVLGVSRATLYRFLDENELRDTASLPRENVG